jgi:hypothetical protein
MVFKKYWSDLRKFLLYGSAADGKVSTWSNHNCTLDLGDNSNTIQYYTD